MMIRSLRFLCLGFTLLPLACGSDGTTSEVSPLVCDAGAFQLQGTVGGEPLDVRESSAGGGLTQLDGGELQIGDVPETAGMPVTKMDLTWSRGLVDGDSSSASGTVTLTGGQFAGQTLCVGKGTKVTIYKDDKGVGFVLSGFASGAACDKPIDGTVAGCWR